MTNLIRVAALFALFSLSACGAEVEELCKKQIEDSLINPETVEFFDFRSIELSEFRAGFENMGFREHNIAPDDRWEYGDQLKGTIDETMGSLEYVGSKYHAVRIKADSRVGLKVTSNYVCASGVETGTTEPYCSCIRSDVE